jgi:hypothetical protein
MQTEEYANLLKHDRCKGKHRKQTRRSTKTSLKTTGARKGIENKPGGARKPP